MSIDHRAVEEIQKELLAELRRQMNGAVSQTMRELGQRESLNFGVSLPTIKEIALRYAPNHDLARLLGVKKSREAKIAALYVAQPDLLTSDDVEQWSAGWETKEIARLSARVLIAKYDRWEVFASEWLTLDCRLKRLAVFYMIGQNAATVSCSLVESVLEGNIENEPAAAVNYCLRELYAARYEFRERISAMAESLPDLKWQIEYI